MKKEILVKIELEFDENEQTEDEVKDSLISSLDFAGWKAQIIGTLKP